MTLANLILLVGVWLILLRPVEEPEHTISLRSLVTFSKLKNNTKKPISQLGSVAERSKALD